jgi:hypothetical protein
MKVSIELDLTSQKQAFALQALISSMHGHTLAVNPASSAMNTAKLEADPEKSLEGVAEKAAEEAPKRTRRTKEQIAAEKAAEEAKAMKRQPDETDEDESPFEAETEEEDSDDDLTGGSKQKYSVDDVVQAVSNKLYSTPEDEKKALRTKIKDRLTELGAEKVPDLDPKDTDQFMKFFGKL